MYWVMEHEYLAKGLTETALTTLWVVLAKIFCSVTLTITLILNHFSQQATTENQPTKYRFMQHAVERTQLCACVTRQFKLTFEPLTSPHGVWSTSLTAFEAL